MFDNLYTLFHLCQKKWENTLKKIYWKVTKTNIAGNVGFIVLTKEYAAFKSVQFMVVRIIKSLKLACMHWGEMEWGDMQWGANMQ